MKPLSFAATAAAAVALCLVVARAETPLCPKDCFPAHYWSVDKNDYTKTGAPSFPEQVFLSDRADLGLAFSGGGTRSASATLGALRGMNRNGWLSRVRYISAVSGGSWASVPFVYSVLPLDDLLGTMKADDGDESAERFLKKPNGALAAAIVKSSFFATGALEASAITAKIRQDDIESRFKKGHVALEAFFQVTNRLRRDPDRINKTYTRLIGKAFIDPLLVPGTSASDALFSWSELSLAAMDHGSREQLGLLSLAGGQRPYLIASGTAVQQGTLIEGATAVCADTATFPVLAPVEYTPLYVGVRQVFDVCVKGNDDAPPKTVHIGGGYVEPWAYDTEAIGVPRRESQGSPNSWTGTLDVRIDPKRRFSLADVAASSGAAPELLTITGGPVPDDYKGYVQQVAQVFPAFRHLSVATNTLTDGEIAHADGGAQDNLGVMPLLVRQVKNVFVFINTATKYWRYNDDLRSLFVSIGPPDSDGDKRYNGVLQASDPKVDALELVLSAFDKAQSNGSPYVYCGKNWTVTPSQHFNIRGYTGLNICFFYNAQPAKWAESLPKSVQPEVPKTKNFPWFRTFGQDVPHVIKLKPSEVNLLANMWAWIMTEKSVVDQIHGVVAPGVLP
jgi:hypothetical protein